MSSTTRDTSPPRMFSTKIALPTKARIEAIELLNRRLADAVDLQSQCKQAHWNVKGPQFIALHRLFDEVAGAVTGYVDQIAERIVQLGGVADGTVRMVATRTELLDYPDTMTSGAEHVAALSDVLAQFGRVTRISIEEMNELEDAVSADILTGIVGGIDQWLWFVEAHQQDGPTGDDAS